MPKIKVIQPFNLRLDGKRREFAPGEHEVSAEELDHWFVAACIKEGRAHVLLAGGADADNEAASVPPESELRKMKRGDLEYLADLLDLDPSGLPNKDAIVDLILERQSGDAPGNGENP